MRARVIGTVFGLILVAAASGFAISRWLDDGPGPPPDYVRGSPDWPMSGERPSSLSRVPKGVVTPYKFFVRFFDGKIADGKEVEITERDADKFLISTGFDYNEMTRGTDGKWSGDLTSRVYHVLTETNRYRSRRNPSDRFRLRMHNPRGLMPYYNSPHSLFELDEYGNAHIKISIVHLPDVARIALVDDSYRPMPDTDITLMVSAIQGLAGGVIGNRLLRSDADGILHLDRVKFPFEIQSPDLLGSDSDYTVVGGSLPATVTQGHRLTIMYREPRRVSLKFADDALVEKLAKDAFDFSAVFHVLPLEVPDAPLFRRWEFAGNDLSHTAAGNLQQTGEIDLGGTPAGSFLITIGSDAIGFQTQIVTVLKHDLKYQLVWPYPLEAPGEWREVRFTHGASSIPPGTLVPGRLPHCIHPAISSLRQRLISRENEGRVGQVAVPDGSGVYRYRFGSSVCEATLFLMDGRVFHFPVASLTGTVPLADFPGDASLTVTVLDSSGNPKPGVIVGLTSVEAGLTGSIRLHPVGSEVSPLWRTDSKGMYRLTGVLPGSYCLAILSFPGADPNGRAHGNEANWRVYAETVQHVSLGPSQNPSLSLTLKPVVCPHCGGTGCDHVKE